MYRSMSNSRSAASSGSGLAGVSAHDAEEPGIFGPGFTGHLEWKTDPGWVPCCWKDVATVRNIDKSVYPVHLYYPRGPPITPPVTPSTSANSSSCEGDGEGDKEKDKVFECWICRKTYKRKNDARIHVGEVHLELYRFFCPLCPHKTSRGWSYDRHLRNVHKVHDRDTAEKDKDSLRLCPLIKKKKKSRRSEPCKH